MKAEYKRDLQNNYLILEAAESEKEDGYDLRMAEQNRIHGLLKLHSVRKDGKLYFHYEITSRQPLQSVYEKKKMKSADMLLLFSSLNRTLEEMRRYLLSPQMLAYDPEMIYLEPDRSGVLLCYFPGGNYPVTLLAEFILKKLEHEDPQAVRLGYYFYQQAAGDNFSLTDTLKNILEETQEERNIQQKQSVQQKQNIQQKQSAQQKQGTQQKQGGGPQAEERTESGEISAEEEYHVFHYERKKKRREPASGKKNAGLAEKLFSVIHPAVLLSFLAATVILEILFVLSVTGITETGGCFFLLLSGCMLANRFLQNRKNRKTIWQEEDEEDKEYGKLLEEMYASCKEDEPEPVEETCCLTAQPAGGRLRLVYQSGNEAGQNPPIIEIGETPVYIGKIRGESDVILDCGTVSRTHAKLAQQDGVCTVQDLNSKNGTFLNGKRLPPQKESILREGDFLVFAEVEYRVMQRGGRGPDIGE